MPIFSTNKFNAEDEMDTPQEFERENIDEHILKFSNIRIRVSNLNKVVDINQYNKLFPTNEPGIRTQVDLKRRTKPN